MIRIISYLKQHIHLSQYFQATYNEFYMYLEENFNEKWTWDAETKVKSQGLFGATRSFEHILVFSVVFNCLEPLKPLAAKLQKLNQDIYMVYRVLLIYTRFFL